MDATRWIGGDARCSCGCGRPVESQDRGANRRASTTGKLVGQMEMLAFGDDEDEYRRAFLFEGVSWRNQYTRVVHRELTLAEIRSDAAWKTWRSGARGAVRSARRGRGRGFSSPR
ncbi:MAG: hypothetical protein QOE87_3685 [Gaiellales bacterium]|nr:hypothetical protein [Gaiellales bacterium]